jgi:hypothetical protein
MESYQKPSEPRKFFVCTCVFAIFRKILALGVPVFQLFSEQNQFLLIPPARMYGRFLEVALGRRRGPSYSSGRADA